MRGTRLFGWCLPDMSPEQHQKCKVTNLNADGTERKCSCDCHKEESK